jgi:sulfonate dioxygenase
MPVKISEPLYPDYLPVRPEGLQRYIDVPPFEAEEPGLRADPQLPEIFIPTAKIAQVTPRIGTEIEGVQLSQLTKAGLDQIALLAAQRGVLVFVRHATSEGFLW